MLVVLPFDNFTGDESIDYFLKGMHASLIGDLGKVSALKVIAPWTARAYKNSDLTLEEIAKELKQWNFRLVVNNGKDAGQEVFHIHVHLLAGRKFTWPPG